MILLSLVLFYLGLGCLMMAMPKYHRALSVTVKLSPIQHQAYQWSGWGLLVCSLALAVSEHGLAVGLTTVCGWLTLCGTLQALLYSYRPLWALRLVYWR